MADNDGWLGCLSLVALAGFGWWWWSGSHKPVAAPEQVAASSVADSGNTVAAQPSLASVNQATSAAFQVVPPPPTHRYDFAEGDVYGYIADVSEDDRKRGRATGDVVMYRYLGYRNHEYRLQLLNGNKEAVGVASCTRPCIAISQYAGGQVTRIAYTENSVIGAAFEDAMNGQLRKARVPAYEAPPYQPTTTQGFQAPSAGDGQPVEPPLNGVSE